jgi:hypothetical protein
MHDSKQLIQFTSYQKHVDMVQRKNSSLVSNAFGIVGEIKDCPVNFLPFAQGGGNESQKFSLCI